jgi:hypothetical protein
MSRSTLVAAALIAGRWRAATSRRQRPAPARYRPAAAGARQASQKTQTCEGREPIGSALIHLNDHKLEPV